MKLAGLLLAVALTASVSAQQAQAPAAPQIPFDGVAINSKGHIFVYDRSRVTRRLEFDRLGAFVREIGKDIYGFDFAHVVRIDKDDNIWCVDGNWLKTWGERGTAQGQFNIPHTIASDAAGNVHHAGREAVSLQRGCKFRQSV